MQREQGGRLARVRRRAVGRCIVALVAAGPLASWGAGSARAQAEDPPKRAVIDFVDLGGIRDWRPDGNDALLVQSARGDWYRATFFGPCPGIQFRERLAFVTDGMHRLDRFSSVLVGRERCWFRTFEPIETPVPERDGAATKR